MSTNPRMRIGPGESVARTVMIDRFIAEWMDGGDENWIWGLATLDAPIPDELLVTAVGHLLTLVPVLSTRPRFGLWSGRWLAVDPGDVARLVRRETASSLEEVEVVQKRVTVDFADSTTPPYFHVTSIDGPGEHRLVLQVHHLVVDGEGAKCVFEQFARCCRELSQDPDWSPSGPLEANRSWWQMIRRLKWWQLLGAPLVFLWNTLRFLSMLARPGVTSLLMGDRDGPFTNRRPKKPAFGTLVIPPDEITRVKGALKPTGAKLNDALMAAYMAAVANWNHEKGLRARYVRTVFTGNLRRWWSEPEGTFANMSSIKAIQVRTDRLTDSKAALVPVKSQIDRLKKTFGMDDLWIYLTNAIFPELLTKLPAMLFTKMLARAVAEGAGVTNIGIVSERVGDFGVATSSEYSLLAPFFPAKGVLLTATGFKGALTIHMNFDGVFMDLETAEAFLECLRQELLGLC